MRIYFESTDWYHCNIYQVRFGVFKRLIATATMDLEERIALKIVASHVTIPEALFLRVYQYMLWYRESSTQEEET